MGEELVEVFYCRVWFGDVMSIDSRFLGDSERGFDC